MARFDYHHQITIAVSSRIGGCMYQPYQLPQYGQPFQQMQQPQSYMPQIFQQQQQPGIVGHVISAHEEIKPQDVPMNGTAAYFPVQDGSVIYAKAWNPDGSITTVRYTPVVDTPDDSAQNTPTLVDVMDQLSDIQDLLKAEKKPAPKRTAKKEVEDDAE